MRNTGILMGTPSTDMRYELSIYWRMTEGQALGMLCFEPAPKTARIPLAIPPRLVSRDAARTNSLGSVLNGANLSNFPIISDL
jgi:hypothetical protein